MKYTDNKLTPTENMYLKRKSDGSVYEGSIYIPNSLKDDFEEITRDEYLKLTQQADTQSTDDISQRVDKLEQQLNSNITEVASISKVVNVIQDMLAGIGNLTKL